MQVTNLAISRSKNPGVKGEQSLPDCPRVKLFLQNIYSIEMTHLRHEFRKVTVGHK